MIFKHNTMKTRTLLIAAALLIVASCGKKLPFVSFDQAQYSPEAKAALPTQELMDSLAYLIGTTEGQEMASYGKLVHERVFKAAADFATVDYDQFDQAAISNFSEDVPDGLLETFEYSPALLGEVGERFAQTPAEDRTPEQIDSMSYLYGILLGYQIHGIDIDLERVRKGADDFAAIDTDGQFEAFAQADFEDETYAAYAARYEIDPKLFSQVISNYYEAKEKAEIINYEEQGKTFFKKVAANPGFRAKEVEYTSYDDGTEAKATAKILYRIVTKGDGEKIEFGDSFNVTYKGMHVNGEVFDEGEFPVEEFSEEGLITGFIQALLIMREGGKMELVIPSELGYGKEGSPDWWNGGYFIYPNEVLVFEISVSDLVKGGPHDSLPMEQLEEEPDSLITQVVEF